MLAAGTPPVSSAILYEAAPITRRFTEATQLQRFAFTTPGFSDPPSVVLGIAYRHDEQGRLVPSSAGWLAINYSSLEGGRFQRSLETAAGMLPHVERWGSDQRCAMYDRTTYFVDRADTDCDGIANDDDCDDKTFCDPAATSPAAQAGCNVSRCGRCEVSGASCALGTRSTCHDVRGQPRTYTCDAGGECGAITACLPANACQLDCGQPPAIDPLPCLERAWGDGAQAADAIDCPLPTTHSQLGSTSCRGGSTVQLALPFPGCSNPRVQVGYSTDLAARPALTPPCTLRVTIDSTQTLVRQPLLVTMDTATGSATVRLTLHPTDGDCSAVGACDAVKSTATCEL